MLGKLFKQFIGWETPRKQRHAVSPGQNLLSRKLRLEALEDRRVLSAATDIIFLFDESASGVNSPLPDWIAEVAQELTLQIGLSDADARFGLVGFGEDQIQQYAHSHLIDTNNDSNGDSLFGTAAQFSITAAAINDSLGGTEDGWDAIEHAIAEYNFREGAAVVFVLIQNGTGRNYLNTTLTNTGVLAALESYNVSLVSVVEAPFDFNLGEPVFGVETPSRDGDQDVTTHTAYVAGVGANYATTTFDDDLHSINGAPAEDGSPGDTDNDYVRLAWDTDGSAWNIGVVRGNFHRVYQQAEDLMDAFNAAFLDSVTSLIETKLATFDTVLPDIPLLELDMGILAGTNVGSYVSDA
jgi:hypothetical protein